jgi:uncharacterized paraquat-inducible protein A
MKLVCRRCHFAHRTPGLDSLRSRLLTAHRCPRCGYRIATREQRELVWVAFVLALCALVFLLLRIKPRG